MSLLVHIGYHKTATTWLQRRLFEPANGFTQIVTHQEVWDHLAGPHGLNFTPEPMARLIAERRKTVPDGQTPVISSELISGLPFQGGAGSDINATRLAKIVPDARVLISIRSQMKILPSVYMQYLRRGGTMAPKRFFNETHVMGYPGFSSDHFCFDRLISRYQSLFSQVKVVTQESINSNPNTAARSIAEFAGNPHFKDLSDTTREARSIPEGAAWMMRGINHLRRTPINPAPFLSLGGDPCLAYSAIERVTTTRPIKAFVAKRKPIQSFIKERFEDRFTRSNQRLQALVQHPIDLSDYP